MSNPLVSVIIPTFNRAHCIADTIDSVFAQTHQNLEIIVVDDGSSDGTAELLRQRYAGESRLHYHYQVNAGVCAARNRGLDLSRGDFVALLDSDDLWKPFKIQAQLACMNHAPEVGMVWTDMEAIRPDGVVSHPRYLRTMYSTYGLFTNEDLFAKSWDVQDVCGSLPGCSERGRFYVGDIFSQMIMGSLVHTSTVLIRRERLSKVKEFNLALRRSGEDFDFHLRTCREGPVGLLDIPTIQYRRGAEDQLTGDEYNIDRARNFLATIQPFVTKERDRIKLPDSMIEQALANAHSWVGESYLGIGEPGLARHHLIQSLRHRPRQNRLVALIAFSFIPTAVRDGARLWFRAAVHREGPSRSKPEQ